MTKGHMQNLEQDVFAALERLAAACPWERTDIWICRDPDGRLAFTAWINGRQEMGLESRSGHGKTPDEAVADALRGAGSRKPEDRVKDKIQELKAQLWKLEQVTFDLPPYRPGYHLGNGDTKPATEEPKETVIEV